MSTISRIFIGAAPFSEDSPRGIAISQTKRAIIGLIFSVAIAAGIYFASMAIYGAYNPLNFSVSTQMGLSIATSVILGLTGLCCTGCFAHYPKSRTLQQSFGMYKQSMSIVKDALTKSEQKEPDPKNDEQAEKKA